MSPRFYLIAFLRLVLFPLFSIQAQDYCKIWGIFGDALDFAAEGRSLKELVGLHP
jgi:hypothetical protein